MSIPTLVRVLVFASGMALAACTAAQEDVPAPMPIRIDGSSTVYPVSQEIAAAFAQAESGAVAVDVQESGTGGGFEKFCAGELDILDASRSIRTAEMLTCFNNDVRYVEAPIGFDGVTVIVHPDNPVTSITVEELRLMWEGASEGVVTNWRQINPAWPDQPISLFGPGTASGTYDYFVEAVQDEPTPLRTDYTASEDDNVIVDGVAGDINALGFLGHSYYERNAERLRALAVDSGLGPMRPTTENIRSGDYSPLSRPIFIYVNASSLERPEVAHFVDFYLSNAERIVEDVGYVALPPDSYDVYRARVENREVGTAFAGRPAVGYTIEQVIAQQLIEPVN
jgi:phosphate transport system substrate-binding protein